MSQKLAKSIVFSFVLGGSLLSSSQSFAELPATITPQMLAGDSQFMGEFVVAEESNREYGAKDLCPQAQNYAGADLWCGRKLWAYRSDSSLILISALNQDDLGTGLLFVWGVDGKSCKGGGDIQAALDLGIAHLGLCSLAALPGNSNRLSATKPTTAGDALVDSVTWIFGLFLGPHTSIVTFQDANSNSFMFEDIVKSLFVDNKMILKKSANFTDPKVNSDEF